MSADPSEPLMTEAGMAAALDRAAALFRAGRLEDAAAAYRVIERQRPTDIRAPYSLAVIDLNLGRPGEARDRLRRVVELAPDHVTAWHNLGAAAQSLRAWQAAGDAYAVALSLRPASETRHALAQMLAVLGRTAEALAHHRVLVETPGTRLRALCRIALLDGAAITPDELAEMRRAATDTAVDPDLRVALHFAAGALLDQGGDIDAAFDACQAGATLKCTLLDRTGARAATAAANAASVREVARIFTPALFKDAERSASVSDAPIFVVGMPRSGSTLIEQVLGAHPDVQDLGETALLPRLLERGGGYDLNDQRRLHGLAEDYLQGAGALGWRGQSRFVDKTLENYVHVGVIARLFPRAVILHSVRDPMDTCLSCFRQLFASGNETLYDLADIGAEYRRYRAVMDHWRKVAPGRVVDVDHEALVADPGHRIRWLVTEAARLPWNEACLSFHARERPLATASAGQARRPIFSESVARWRRYAHRLAPLIEALGPLGPGRS